MSALVVAMVGTDHHPFNRMVDWVDDAAVRHPDTRFVIQYGASRAPLVAEGHEYLAHHRIVELLAEARAVVCHGGPGTIMDARSAEHVPICVPRDPALGEHVDGHQQRFAALVGSAGVVRRVADLVAFRTAMIAALEEGPATTSAIDSRATLSARVELARELDDLLTAPAPRRAGFTVRRPRINRSRR